MGVKHKNKIPIVYRLQPDLQLIAYFPITINSAYPALALSEQPL